MGDGYEQGDLPAGSLTVAGRGEFAMNRAYLIIFVPALLVALGYILVLRSMGFAPGYGRLLVVAGVFGAAIYWLAKRTARKKKTGKI